MPAREPSDPLDAALRPPFDESPEEKVRRLAQEAEARRISQEIDDDIKRERTLRKKRQIVKLLLLGQSESGTCSLSWWLYAPQPRVCPQATPQSFCACRQLAVIGRPN